MSLIFPKKEILYAPMLGTLGGGSARGFGRGAGGAIEFPGEPSKLFAISDGSLAYYDLTNSSWSSGRSYDAVNTSVYADGNFPATMGDVALDDEGTPWVYTLGANRFRCAKVNNIAVWNSQDIGINSVRGMVTLRNNVIIMANSGANQIRSYTLNNNGTVTHRDTYGNASDTNNVEMLISPPDFSGSVVLNSTNNTLGSYEGSARLVLYSHGTGVKEFSVSSTGTINFVGTYNISSGMTLGYFPNGYVVAGVNSNSWYLLDQNLSYVTQSGSGLGSTAGGLAMARNGRFYHIEHNYRITQHNLWDSGGTTGNSAYQTAMNVQSAFSGNSTNTPDYGNSIIAIDDHVYWSGYQSSNGWLYVNRIPTGNINMANYTPASSGTQSGTYMEALVSGRPNWANTDEHFVLGTAWQ